MKFIVENEKELVDKILTLLKDKMKAGLTVGLVGDLGAGKTTLVRGILKKLGILEPVTSPTFTLRKIYKLGDGLKIQHIDLYRLDLNVEDPEVKEWLDEEGMISFVEWPERMRNFENNYDLIISLKLIDHHSREVELRWN